MKKYNTPTSVDGLRNPRNPSFLISTSYVVSTAVCACKSVVFFIIDSGEFGSLYARLVPPAELIIGILGLKEGAGGSVDAAADILLKLKWII
jgi:hypothetical protein